MLASVICNGKSILHLGNTRTFHPLSAYPASDLGSRVTLSLELHTLTVLSCVLIPKSFHTFFAFAYVFPFVLNTFSRSDLLGEILFIFHNPIRTSPPLGRLPSIVHLFLFCSTSVLYTHFHYCFATYITCSSVTPTHEYIEDMTVSYSFLY